MLATDGPPLDARIERGMVALLKTLGGRERAGDRHIGWKAAFRTQAAMDLVGIDRPLLGFMTEQSLIKNSATVPLQGWKAPEFDLEIAVRIDLDILPGAPAEVVREAMGPLTVAIELNDYAPLPVDPEPVLATNTYHRAVILGSFEGAQREWPGCVATIEHNGKEVHRRELPGEVPGDDLVEALQEMSDLLAVCGTKLRAGEVVITGGLVPPVKLAPGDSIRTTIEPLGTLELTFA
jgi:2-keto-4-pentenoate hydratase